MVVILGILVLAYLAAMALVLALGLFFFKRRAGKGRR
jgi:hypothetical protein